MTVPRLKVDPKAAVAFDDRSVGDAMIDMAAAAVHGALMASEAEFDGEMSISLEILIRTNHEFLDGVLGEAGAEAEAAYRRRLIEALEGR